VPIRIHKLRIYCKRFIFIADSFSLDYIHLNSLNQLGMERRTFIKHTGIITSAIGLSGTAAMAATFPVSGNRLPKWKGFNLQDFFSNKPITGELKTTEDHFRWMRDWAFDFIRLPLAYPGYVDFDRSRDITPEEVYQINEKAVDTIDSLVTMAHKYNMHVSLNLHRAPGFCINASFKEPYSLWTDQAAQDAFCFHWAMWAKRYKNTSDKKISFDLLNEPCQRIDKNDPHSEKIPIPNDVYRKIINAATAAIRKENPHHLVIADGNNVGSDVIPGIDINIGQSCHGYWPAAMSHYKAPWFGKDPEHMPMPKWPGQVGNEYLSRAMLETYYKPWIELVKKGGGVHCGECGGYNKTPHDVFLAWFGDVLDILSSHQIGFAVWNFFGEFGILDSGRADVDYQDWHGHKLDKGLLDLLMKQ
jgi:endoglucanase